MAYPSIFIPPVYQQAPAGSSDSLSTAPAASPGVLTGTGSPPDSLGSDGCVYFELAADGSVSMFWGPKVAGHWPDSGSPIGGGSAVVAIGGDGPPDSQSVGPIGQIYLDRTNGVIYQAQA